MTGDVFSERCGPFRVTIDLVTTLTSLEISVPGHRPFVAVLDADEMRALLPVFDRMAEHANRGAGVHIDLRAALRAAIGRDPFAA